MKSKSTKDVSMMIYIAPNAENKSPDNFFEFLCLLRRFHDGRGRGDGDGEIGGVEWII